MVHIELFIYSVYTNYIYIFLLKSIKINHFYYLLMFVIFIFIREKLKISFRNGVE